MSKTKAKPAAADLDALIDANLRTRCVHRLTPALAEELKHFAKRAEEGRIIKREALIEYIRTHHNMPTIGATSVHRMVKEAGLKPWFTA